MKVLCIISYDDSNSGNMTAILAIEEGVNTDDLFVEWLRSHSTYYAKKTKEQCLEAEYAWNVNEVQTIVMPRSQS